jgi:hypothetical protein
MGQRQVILGLLLVVFRQMIGRSPKAGHRRLLPLRRMTVETWLGSQGLIFLRPNQNPNVSTNCQQRWYPN